MTAHSIGTATSAGSATSGPFSSSAPTVNPPTTMATRVSGIAYRADVLSVSTSRDARVTRSPVPARSTVDSGSARTRSTNSSRSSASTRSPSFADAR